MKKTTFICLILLLFSQCSSLTKSTRPEKKIYKNHNTSIDTDCDTDWSLYSKGLYYESIKDYKKAEKYYLDAAKFNIALDMVYYHLAKCNYYMLDFKSAIKYSKMAIKWNKNNLKPYILLHGIHLNLKEFQEAANVYETLIKLKPDYIRIHFSLGILYYNRIKNYGKALHFFNKILELADAISVENYYIEYANYYIGCIYHVKNDLENSIKHIKKVLEINPDNYPSIYLLSYIMMDKYYLDEARKYISSYLRVVPTNPNLNSFMGRIYYLENSPKSIEYLKKGISTENIYGLLAKSLYLEKLGKDKEAEKYLKVITEKFPMFISPHIALAKINLRKNNKKDALSNFFTAGILLYKVKLYNKAKENLIKALSINDKIPEVYYYLGKIDEETGKYHLAIINYKKANEIKQSILLLIHIGNIYSQLNNFEKSIKYFNVAIDLEPKNPKPYFFKGLVYSHISEYIQAEKLFKKAIELNNDNDIYYFYLATVLEKQDKMKETIYSLKKAIQYNPRNAKAYNYLGYIYAENNININESIDLIQEALKIEPFNGSYLDSLGWAYYKKGEFKLALKKLLAAEKLLEKKELTDPVVFDHIGDTYKKIGNEQKAVKYWKRSVNLEKNPHVEKKIEEITR